MTSAQRIASGLKTCVTHFSICKATTGMAERESSNLITHYTAAHICDGWRSSFELFSWSKSVVPSTAVRSHQDSWASPAKKIRPLEKKLGRKPTPNPHQLNKSSKNLFIEILGQFLPIIVRIRLQLWNLELGHFLGLWFPRPQEFSLGHCEVLRPRIQPSGSSGPETCSQLSTRRRVLIPFFNLWSKL